MMDKFDGNGDGSIDYGEQQRLTAAAFPSKRREKERERGFKRASGFRGL